MNIWHLTEKMVNHLEPSIPAHLVAGSHEITTSGRSYLRSILRGSAPGPGSAIPWHGAEVVSPRVRLPSLPDDNQPPPAAQDAERDVTDERPHRFKVRQQGDEKGSRDDKVDVPELAETVRNVGTRRDRRALRREMLETRQDSHEERQVDRIRRGREVRERSVDRWRDRKSVVEGSRARPGWS